MISKPTGDETESTSSSWFSGADANFITMLGNVVQLVGLFIAVLAPITSAKQSSSALDVAEERMTRIQKDVADVDLQLRKARKAQRGGR